MDKIFNAIIDFIENNNQYTSWLFEPIQIGDFSMSPFQWFLSFGLLVIFGVMLARLFNPLK